MSNDSSNINAKDFLIGALIGGVVGSIGALMLAPKSGRELRDDINEQSKVLKGKTTNIANYAKEKSSNIAQTVSQQSNQVVGKVKDLKDNLKSKNVEDLTDDFSDHLTEEPKSETLYDGTIDDEDNK